MDQEYDAIVLGTGLKECILSGLLSVAGKKVLHMDRNNYYGGESTSFNLTQVLVQMGVLLQFDEWLHLLYQCRSAMTRCVGSGMATALAFMMKVGIQRSVQLWEKHRPGQEVPAELGANRDWNIDLVPKFIIANGKLVHALVHTGVTRYMDFKAVEGSYVLKKDRVRKVPATDAEALTTDLVGFFEKRRLHSFFQYVQQYDETNPNTYKSYNLLVMTMDQLYQKYGLAEETIEFIGHAVALNPDNAYRRRPALPTVKRLQLYYQSLTRFAGLKSPYIYPLYGLGELPQGFARLAAVHGGTYMLSKPDLEINFGEDGKFMGVTDDQGDTARAPLVIGDPSYFPDKTQVVGKVVRAICIMSHAIPNTGDSHSVQIIVPFSQVARKNDIYIFCSSYSHNVAAQGKYIAFVSTTVETGTPEAELEAGIRLLGPVQEKFIIVSDLHEPVADGKSDNVFISSGYDATSHFESTIGDVLAMYTRITGQTLDVSSPLVEGLSES